MHTLKTNYRIYLTFPRNKKTLKSAYESIKYLKRKMIAVNSFKLSFKCSKLIWCCCLLLLPLFLLFCFVSFFLIFNQSNYVNNACRLFIVFTKFKFNAFNIDSIYVLWTKHVIVNSQFHSLIVCVQMQTLAELICKARNYWRLTWPS